MASLSSCRDRNTPRLGRFFARLATSCHFMAGELRGMTQATRSTGVPNTSSYYDCLKVAVAVL